MSWPVGVTRTLNAEQRTERARQAALSRTSPDYFIRQLSKATLTAEQRRELAELLFSATAQEAS